MGFLKRFGYDADLAENGEEAVRQVKSRSYDLVLMDYHMPVLDGTEAAHKITQEVPEDGRPKLVALTASVASQDIQRFQSVGITDIIGKPIQLLELLRVLRETYIQSRMRSKTKPEAKTEKNQLFDLEKFLANYSGIVSIARTAIDGFLALSPKYVEELRLALEGKDISKAEIAAHSIKGMLAAFYSEKGRKIAETIEHESAEGRFDGLREKFEELSAEVEKLNIELAELNLESIGSKAA
jgi:CheY-like chemotaxis protein